MKHYKKALAGILAGTMVIGTSLTVFAADENGSTTGTGSLDIVEKSDVFSVVLPTIPENGDTTFNYILDPTGVIKDTEGAKYSGATFADGKTVFFANAGASGGAVTYSDTSDTLTITNKSTMDVDVTVKATVKAVDGIKMASSGTFDASDTEAKLYLALKDADTANSEKAITTDGAELTSTIQALAGAYETKYEGGKYVKKLKDTATGFKTYSFQVTGACNPNGAWNGLTENPPEIEVVWNVKDPTVTGPQMTVSQTGLITITGLTSEKNYSALKIQNSNGGPYHVNDAACTWGEDNYNAEEGGSLTCQLGEEWLSTLRGITTGKAILELTDGSKVEVNISIPEVSE